MQSIQNPREVAKTEVPGDLSGVRVAITGAGLGGLCLAQGLTCAGADVTIYERDASLNARRQGYRLHIDARAGLALQRFCRQSCSHCSWLPAANPTSATR